MFMRATKEGWDGRQIRKAGEVFPFDGERGSWMVPCDEAGNPLKGEALPPPEREVRAGAKKPTGSTRNDLRAECQRLGIPFKATMGAIDLAELIKKHNEGAAAKAPVSSPENPDGGAPGFATGTGDQDVI